MNDSIYQPRFVPQPFENISQAVNKTSYFPILQWTWYQISLSVILFPIVVTTIFGNLFVLWDFGTRTRSSLRSLTPTHYFIANLSLADFLVGILVLPFLALIQINERWIFGQKYCTAWICIHFWLCAASILSTCSVCIERYIGVRYPIQHIQLLSRKRIYLMILGVWVLAGIPSTIRVFLWSPPFVDKEYQCKLNQRLGHVIFACLYVLYIPATIMVILYWQIYKIASQHLNAVKVNQSCADGLRFNQSQRKHCDKAKLDTRKMSFSSGLSTSSENLSSLESKEGTRNSKMSITSSYSPKKVLTAEQRQIRLAKKLSFLVGVVLLSYVPYFTLILVRSINPEVVHPYLFRVFEWIRYFNSCLNPFIYAYAVPAYKKSLVRTVSRIRGKSVYEMSLSH